MTDLEKFARQARAERALAIGEALGTAIIWICELPKRIFVQFKASK